MIFFLDMMLFNWQNFRGVSALFSFPPQFLDKNVKITFLKKKRALIVVFIELECRWLQTGLPDFENTKHLYFFLRADVYAFLKISHFSRFLKSISSTCLNG